MQTPLLQNKFTRYLLLLISVLCPLKTWASAFQLWEQDGASVGNYHAGYAVDAKDASIAFYNPAGITQFTKQQWVVSADNITTAFKYQGTVAVNTIAGGAPETVTAQGGNYNLIPAMHYITPLNEWLGWGFSIVVPFGLKTTYGKQTAIKYAATTAGITVVDISPSLGFALSPKTAFGLGLDMQDAAAEFNQPGGLGKDPTINGDSQNKFTGTGYGAHAGILQTFSDTQKIGLSYHSQVVQHLTGSSLFTGDLANAYNNGPLYSRTYTNLTLPAYTALSGYQKLSDRTNIMASLLYTQWNIAKTLILHNVAGIDANLDASPDITITVPQYYRNTWNVAVGANYQATETILLRYGVGYDQTPVQNKFRNVTLPDNNRMVIALGGHYETSKTMSVDVAWSHVLMRQAQIYPPALVSGAEQITTIGKVNGGADILTAQLTWNLT